MNKLLNYLLGLLLLLFSFLGKAQQLSFDECLRLGKENQSDFKIQQLKMHQKEQTKRSIASQFLPEIGFSASHAYNFGSSIDPSTNNRLPTNIQSDNLSFDIRIQLFDFSKWKQTVIENLDIEMEQVEFSVLETKFELLVLEKYIKALSLQEWKKSLISQFNNSKEQLRRIEKETEEGKRPQSDAYDIRVVYLQDENLLKKTAQEEILAKLELIQLLNTSNETIQNTPELQTVIPLMKQEDINLENHPSIRKYTLKDKKNREEFKQLLGNFLPSLGVNYAYGTFFSQKINTFSDTGFQFGNQLKENKSQYIGLSLYVPLFNKGINTQKRKLKDSEYEIIKEEEIKERKLLNDILVRETEKLRLLQGLQKSLEDLVWASEKSFKTTEIKYIFDKVDTSVYKTAKNQLLKAQYDKLSNQLEQIFSAYQLHLNFGE